jgi:hypothetical protein
MKKTTVFIMISLFITIQIFAQNSIEDFRKICFCTYGVAHPYSVLNLDNNWDLLFAFEDGKSKGELDSLEIHFTESQIAILKLWGLIEKRNDKYYSQIPVIYANEATIIRQHTQTYAKEIIKIIERDYLELVKVLKKDELEKNIFPIFFAFILDDLVWQHLRNDTLISPHFITKEKPFWDGTLWLIQPKRNFSCGTNTIGYENFYIHMNWNGDLDIELPDYNLLKKMLKDYKTDGRISNAEVIAKLKEYQFFDEDGKLLLPVIESDSSNSIYVKSETMSQKVVDYLKQNLDYNLLKESFPKINNEQAITIIYHEIMWDILSIMEENGKLRKPDAFIDADNATERHLKDLIFPIFFHY